MPGLTVAGAGAEAREAAFAAYHRGDADARARVAAALDEHPRDGGLLIADAVLAQESGAPDPDVRIAAMLDRAPDWIDGHVALAELRWGRGEQAGCLDRMAAAARAQPRHAALWLRYLALLAACGRAREAADAVRELRGRADVPALALLEARYASTAGDLARAATLLDHLPADTPDRPLELARVALRRGDLVMADSQLAAHRAAHPHDRIGWGLTELVWRTTGNPRHAWLMADGALLYRRTNGIDPDDVKEICALLRSIHGHRWPPLGQSIRQGTQTRGHLFRRGDALLRDLHAQLDRELMAFRATLPVFDADHPLHGADASEWSIDTSWSVRLARGGHHAAHVHPAGWFSAAIHLNALPHAAGELVLGMAPADMLAGLKPLAVQRPAPGQLQLFPSFLYHGTRPVQAEERLTISFDVVCRPHAALGPTRHALATQAS